MPIRPCIEPGCPRPAEVRGRCRAHHRERERDRSRRRRQDAARATYAKQKWRNTRAAVLFDQPICAECGSRLADQVDHVTPLRDGGQAYARDNLQGLCARCHGAKSAHEARERAAKGGGG